MKMFLIAFLVSTSALAATWEEKVVAAVLVGEARGEGKRGLIAVGEVIHQRCVERKQTPYKVVTSKGEFSSKGSRTAEQMVRRFSRDATYASALEVAMTVCRRPEQLPGLTRRADVRANSFDQKDRRPWWTANAVEVATIGRHTFWRVP